VQANKVLLGALRSQEADRLPFLPAQHSSFAALRGHKHCLLVTYRRGGRPVAQPVWPAFDGERVLVWTEHKAFKALRLRNEPRALLAPCTFRGRPLGPPLAAVGRVLPAGAQTEIAASIVAASRGWKRRAFERLSRPLTPVVYLELEPAPPESRTVFVSPQY
jgi:PPOX class probable F420-dependent enzyme